MVWKHPTQYLTDTTTIGVVSFVFLFPLLLLLLTVFVLAVGAVLKIVRDTTATTVVFFLGPFHIQSTDHFDQIWIFLPH